MGKIKSAVITAILVAAIVVLALFATISCTVPGSNGVKRYNSFISSIKLGSGLTGEATAVLYPDGVRSAADYTFGIPDEQEKRAEYVAKYVQCGSVYVEKDKLDEAGGEDAFKAEVAKDAEVLSKRFGERGYSAYSVSVQDGYTVKVTVPTGFTYAAYKQYDTSARSEETSAISQTVEYLSYSGELSLRNSEVGKTSFDNILTPVKADITSYFKSVSKMATAGNYAVKLNLTDSGRKLFKEISGSVMNASDDKAIGFYVGDDQLLSLSVSSEIDQKSFYITVQTESQALDYAVVLNSVVHGQTLSHVYNFDNADIVYLSSPLGDLSAVLFCVALVLILIAAVVYSIVRYKKLGLVNTIMIAIYALTIIIALLLIEIEFTIAGAVAAVLGLALMCGSNFALFETVRRETKKGKTIQSSIKSGYKKIFTAILELHVVLLVVAFMLTLIAVGELSACGFIFFIATVASYILYWFTRLMWYVISSPVKNKFAFCGFAREEQIDE